MCMVSVPVYVPKNQTYTDASAPVWVFTLENINPKEVGKSTRRTKENVTLYWLGNPQVPRGGENPPSLLYPRNPEKPAGIGTSYTGLLAEREIFL